MLLFLYVFLPLYLAVTQGGELRSYVSEGDLAYVQLINWLGVVSLCSGTLIGGRSAGRWDEVRAEPEALSPAAHRRLVRTGVVLGAIALAGYLFQVANVGGFGEAYGRGYGGGWSDSGYVRETPLLAVPALLLLMAAHVNRRLSGGDWLLLLLCASPLLVHGLLGARRGPIFMVAVTLCAGWYFMRFRRPRLATTLLAGLTLGLIMLFLVANRSSIYLGSDLAFDRGLESYVFDAGPGNEFVYGAGSILHADATDRYWWGRRYVVVLFVRPIPRSLWPTKYEDASAALGVPNIERNLGTGADAFDRTLGWTGSLGAAPGLVADMWIEFWLLAFVVLFAIGWFYGRAWSRAVQQGGAWISAYCVMLALAAYLVLQTLEAMLFRFLLLAMPLWFAWRHVGARNEEPQPLRWRRRSSQPAIARTGSAARARAASHREAEAVNPAPPDPALPVMRRRAPSPPPGDAGAAAGRKQSGPPRYLRRKGVRRPLSTT